MDQNNQTQNRKNGWKIALGVFASLVVFICLLFLIEKAFFGGETKEKSKIVNTEKQAFSPSWKKKVDKTLNNHGARINDLEDRVDRNANAITDLQSQVNEWKNGKEQKSEVNQTEQPLEKNKYQKGWNEKKKPVDYKDSWE